MRVSDFNYNLPQNLIAQHPPRLRGNSRLLVLDKQYGSVLHREYANFVDYVSPGDVVVLNDTKVIKARLIAKNSAGQDRELLLLEDHHNTDFTRRRALYRGKLRKGEQLDIKTTKLKVDKVLDGGIVQISGSVNLLDLAENQGTVPLPPYMHRGATAEDAVRYQTVFAREPGSVAAPTASLNFTHELEKKLNDKGATLVYLTLHVGLGTFLPIRSDDVESHQMHSEYFEIPAETVQAIHTAKSEGSKVFAVGTTVTRTLEFCSTQIISGTFGLEGEQESNEQRTKRTSSTKSESRRLLTPQSVAAESILRGEADIFIYPGYEFKVVDALLTNFHAPKTTVLMMAAAFAGWDNLRRAYEDAIKENYAFLSYGDSMLII